MTKPAGFKPMLAGKVTEPEKLKFPAVVSPKIDGIRCTVFYEDGAHRGFSRSGKEFPNRFVRDWIDANGDDLEYKDGELVVGSATDPNCMQNTMSGIMSPDGEPDFKFYVFDLVNTCPFNERCEQFTSYVMHYRDGLRMSNVELVPQYRIGSLEEFNLLEAKFVEQGYEGMMYRSEGGAYKFGRSTEREGYLLKVKRFDDGEAIVIGYEQEQDKYGNPKGTLGALVCRDLTTDIEFCIGSGFTAKDREVLWYLRDELRGKLVTYKFFNHGIRVAPRHPVWKGFRDPIDLSV